MVVFWVDGDDYDGLDEVYTEYCKKANIISEFTVRFHPMLGNGHNVKEVYQVQELDSTVYIDLTCSEKIWEKFYLVKIEETLLHWRAKKTWRWDILGS